MILTISLGYLSFNSQLCTAGISSDVVFEYTSPSKTQLSPGCLEFSFYMWGETVQSLKITHINSLGSSETVWRKRGPIESVWYREMITLETLGTKIIFTANCGETGTSDIAIDNISLIDKPCPGKYNA